MMNIYSKMVISVLYWHAVLLLVTFAAYFMQGEKKANRLIMIYVLWVLTVDYTFTSVKKKHHYAHFKS